MLKREIERKQQPNLRSPAPQFRLSKTHRAVVVGQLRASAVHGGVDCNVARVEQVENIVRNDNCERVRLSRGMAKGK